MVSTLKRKHLNKRLPNQSNDSWNDFAFGNNIRVDVAEDEIENLRTKSLLKNLWIERPVRTMKVKTRSLKEMPPTELGKRLKVALLLSKTEWTMWSY